MENDEGVFCNVCKEPINNANDINGLCATCHNIQLKDFLGEKY